MKYRNIVPATKYRFRVGLQGYSIFLGIMLLVFTVLTLLSWRFADQGVHVVSSMSFFTMSAAIAAFVTGIAGIREDFRLMTQHGVGRPSFFAAQLITLTFFALILAVGGEVILALFQFIARNRPEIVITDIFYFAYFEDMSLHPSLWARVQNLLCSAGLYMLAQHGGMFISLGLYRLRKAGVIGVSIGVPVFFVVILPIMISYGMIPAVILNGVARLILTMVKTPWSLMVSFVVLSALCALFNWLLLRRAPVKAAQQ